MIVSTTLLCGLGKVIVSPEISIFWHIKMGVYYGCDVHENALATIKHYKNVNDNSKNNKCSKYFSYTQHYKEIKTH